MRTLHKLIPVEAIELVDHHGSHALLIARTHLAQARDAGDEVRAARWQTVSEAIITILEEQKCHAPPRKKLTTEKG